MRTLLATALAATLLASTAHAAPWVVDAGKSTLTFSGKQGKSPFTGSFATFTPVIEFDPAAPEKGSITVTVDTGSASIADDREQNDALPTEDWFFPKQFPEATFTSKTITREGEGYRAEGTLTLRGVSKPVSLPFTLKAEGTATRAEGETVLNRTDFGLGGKQWADDKWVAYPVTVRFSLLATPAK